MTIGSFQQTKADDKNLGYKQMFIFLYLFIHWGLMFILSHKTKDKAQTDGCVYLQQRTCWDQCRWCRHQIFCKHCRPVPSQWLRNRFSYRAQLPLLSWVEMECCKRNQRLLLQACRRHLVGYWQVIHFHKLFSLYFSISVMVKNRRFQRFCRKDH